MSILTSSSRSIATLLCLALLLAACGTSTEERADTLDARELYEAAKTSMTAGQYDDAVTYYKRLQARFPFGPYSAQGMIELAYAHWKNYEPEEALAVADRFIREHPTHAHVDYAYYLKGLINFEREKTIAERIFTEEQSTRDQTHARSAFLAFKELVQRFPDSPYAVDARQRMLFLRHNMALHELHIAEFYLEREAYIAAANRASNLVETYEETGATAGALVVMAKAYEKMNMPELAQDARRVLEHNYPAHPYLTGEEESDFLGWLWPFG